MIAALLLSVGLTASACGSTPDQIHQGEQWTDERRNEFYSLDQGSRIMPLRWIRALKLPNGSSFMANDLRRYGFLPNRASHAGLPVGFTAAGAVGEEVVGLTCAACHTRQIEVAGRRYRIDGGPSIIDFQAFLSDLDIAVGRVLYDPARFSRFARDVLGGSHPPDAEMMLHAAVNEWHYRYHMLMYKALPSNPWGPGRQDAVGMILNRLTGLDLGMQANDVIEQNMRVADAPVRYPFLWNAHKQDMTQWAGFARNYAPEHALGRNIGQVYGTFGDFHPEKQSSEVNYLSHNSASIPNLVTLEARTAQIGPPRWPWAIDKTLRDAGEKIFNRNGSCVDCHGKRESQDHPGYWTTTLVPIGMINTDRRHFASLGLPRQTGVLEGTRIPCEQEAIKAPEMSLDILRFAVIGALEDLAGKCASPDPSAETIGPLVDGRSYMPVYEARVLEGVWAAAPYLHNGSVPTLTELLKPSADRKPSFQVGPAYDVKNVGLADRQTQFSFTLTTTLDCNNPISGNSRCGHEGPEYGTQLSDSEKTALLEYLKSL